MMCSVKNATIDLLKDMQSANVPIIPTNDRITNLVNVVGRTDAHWDDEIAKEVIMLYDTIAPWKNRINDIVGCCLNTCNSIEEKERGQNPCDHILYNWSVLISVYEDHAIAYRSQIEPTPSTEATATDSKRAICLRSIVDHINDNLCKDLHKSVADVVMLIGDQIGQYINSIGTVDYLKFIEDNIADHPKLNIYGQGNPILDKTREGNLFFAIDRLVGLFVGVNPDEQMNGNAYCQLCYECANIIRLSGWVDVDGCKPQTIYYNLWDCTLPLENAPQWGWYGHYLAKARVTDRFLFVTSIQENNKYFIDQLEDWGRIKKDWSSIATVLEYMLNEYAKRRFCIDNRGDAVQYKIDWLNNTILMCGDSKMSVFKMVINWCEDQLQHLNWNAPEPPRHEPPQAAEANATDDAQPSPKVDADRLGSFFNAKFKGAGNNPDRIKDLVNDIEKIKVTKELAMIAVMIYDCRQYFIRRSSTFAAWLREFFDIIGRDCPKDTHKNKYKPDERIERLFYYLK